MIVVDASVAVSWLLNETSPIFGLDDFLAAQRIVVPAHWTIEIGHAMLKALRRKTISQDRLSIIATNLKVLNVAIETPVDPSSILPLLRFASENGLTMYDAAYVQLAIDKEVELATLDIAMGKAAERLGVKLFRG